MGFRGDEICTLGMWRKVGWRGEGGIVAVLGDE